MLMTIESHIAVNLVTYHQDVVRNAEVSQFTQGFSVPNQAGGIMRIREDEHTD